MRWEVAIPPEGPGEPKTHRVEGDTWLSALSAGLQRSGIKKGAGESGFAALIHDDGVDVSDFGLNRRITCRYVDPQPRRGEGAAAVVAYVAPTPAAPAHAPAPVPAALAATAAGPGLPPKVAGTGGPKVPHQVLFRRDEDRDAKNAVTYRERVLAVAPGTSRGDVERLLRAVFDDLSAQIADKPAGKFIHVTVFDAIFQGPPTRPALGALSWKDWRGGGPDVSFPVQTAPAPTPLPEQKTPPPKAVVVQPSTVPPTPHSATVPMPAAKVPKAAAPKAAIPATPAKGLPAFDAAASMPAPLPGPRTLVDRSEPAPIAERVTPVPDRGDRISWIPQSTGTGRHRRPSAELLRETAQNADDLLAEVFEAMQDLYGTRSREEAARFALTLSIQKVPCEASAILLHDLATGELVFVAALGTGTDKLAGVRQARDHGLIGHALALGEPVVISDPADPKIDPDFDRMTGIKTTTTACVPITHDGRALGALQLVNRRGGKAFTSAEANLLAYIMEKLAEHLVQNLPELQID